MAQANVNHTTVEYRLDGPDGAPVIALSNSLASNLTMWNPQVPELLDAGFQVLRYDSRGHGGSSVQHGPYTMQMLTGDLAALLDHLEFDQVCVMGCSMGGMVAQMLASTHPERVRALVLTATACQMPPPELWETIAGTGQTAIVRTQKPTVSSGSPSSTPEPCRMTRYR